MRRSILGLGLLVALGAAGCQKGEPALAITSPADGWTGDGGTEVTLSAAVTDRDGFDVGNAEVTWTAAGWSATGNDLVVTDLPVGALDLTATATVDEVTVSDTVSIEVTEPPFDPTGDYTGGLDMDFELTSDFGNFSGECTDNGLSFTIASDMTLEGTGGCSVDVGGFYTQDFAFTLTGEVDGTTVSGTMQADGADQTMAFSGTIDEDTSHVQCSYDETFAGGNGSIRLFGTFDADPVE